ncbi:hypothetical protein CSB45_12070 [candidate division KSB3 bacterium]|uniref:Probable membrane transporter protein n=1 Tax=candidate division KSB3 bacterium TaxID=2044937 RepID=A0A2G6E2X7_9BACT|nr:MAG: hypothetical protein CSB45_12070 [candidate division KSB3 bacterium]PIE28834.1 MAG: hypothetical protein CSA57_11745 [candidate division KSB3 bacterium]
MLEWYMVPLTISAGFLTGFINTLAGSGSAVSLALLNALGIPLDVANGTNRIGILLQNAVAVAGFHQQKKLEWHNGLRLTLPAVIGAVAGAFFAGTIDKDTLRIAVGIAMLLVLIVLFIKPKRWLEGKTGEAESRPGILQMLIFFGIGLYGGFIQVGVGVFLLAGLVLNAGYDLLRGNAIKVLIVLGFTIPALAMFVYHDKVLWGTGLTLAIGNMLGAWVATKEASKRGAVFVRWLLIVVVTFSAARYLGIFDLF